MKSKHIVVILVLLVVVLAFSVYSAPIDLEESCTANEECESFCELNYLDEGICYCNEAGLCIWDPEAESATTEPVDSVVNVTVPDVNATIETNITNETVETIAVSTVYEETITELQQQITSLQGNGTATQQRLATLEQSVSTLLTQMNSLNTNVESINTIQSQIQQDLSGNINDISTGLAGLQLDVETTQSDIISVEESANTTRTIAYILLFIVILIAGIGGVYYITRKGSSKSTKPKIVNYITQHIKQGQKYPTIKNALLKAGWSEPEIEHAYKSTLKHNYQQYLQRSGKTSQTTQTQRRSTSTPQQGIDKKKVAVIAVFSILIIIGAFFIIKGVTTGHAIYFQTEAELSTSMKSVLEKNIENNVFYDKVDKIHMCVQVQDGENSASYHVVKINGKHTFVEAQEPCDYLPPFDVGAKFTNWKSFESVMKSPTCNSLRKAHSNEEVYVLPSKYVLQGFELNKNEKYSPFCNALKTCLVEKELAAIGITC
ncbi:hypothetical protein HOL21_00400 [Candidatus Woesearchaeota archaeon]|jgi:hypothetical protein|nr:hypothetical protein [Candidatus Woesearchaeota archaeon]MBT5396657.1 hypothetical protein [Candidatus Woesearchaeota archaeon]MBT6367556.1 hypothetical protein [Candidatus Woesearchaeota archaeon]MBT7763055.1 hypothetical protein [Candidatus Woesearchaeota archaeon]